MRSIKGFTSFLRKNIFFLVFVVLLFVPLGALLLPGLPLTHDGQDHVARIANFYHNLEEGNFIPRWGGNLNWGYGHPVLMFLYPLPSYLASLFHFIGFSFVESTKLVFVVSFVLSILTMYLWLRTFLTEKAAILGALLYGYAPYHFVDLYVRGAIGELVAFVFPPLVLYFLFKFSQRNNYWYLFGGSASLAGFILAHNAVSLMFLPVLIFYAAFLIWQSKKRIFLISHFSSVIFFGFALSAFFWLPAFAEGKYTLRDIVTDNVYQDRFVSLSQLFYGPWNYGQTGEFTVQVGLVHWIFILIALPVLFFLFKQKDKKWVLLTGFLGIFFIALFVMTPFTKVLWDNVTILQKFQFPWRFLFLTMFASAVVGAIVFALIPKKWQSVSLALCILLLLFTTKDMWYPKTYLHYPQAFYSGIYNGTTDTGESAPIWSVRFMEHEPQSVLEVIDGDAQIEVGERTSTKHTYVVTVSERTRMRENTLYFPGWEVFVDGQKASIEFQDANHRGLMTFWLEQGQHEVVVAFGETKLRTVANWISVISLFVLIGWGILRKVVKSKVIKW